MIPRTKDPLKELETALSELDERVDRLRGLYEQYFLGFEKSEPRILRSDVDRRVAQLRKTPIKNTALRFRFNVIAQKLTTYSMYWSRICRQIEDGTYKRHVTRAAKKFGAPPAPKVEEPSVEIQLEELEARDMAELLAEANAAIDARTGPPSLPRPSSSAPSAPPLSIGARPRPRNPLDEVPTLVSPLRPVRQAALPPGAKQPVLARRRSDEPPMSNPFLPSAPPPALLNLAPPPASATGPGSRPVSSRVVPSAPPSAPASAPGSAGDLPPPSLRDGAMSPRAYRPAAQGPVSVRAPISVRAPGSGRLPEAPPSASGAPASRRIVKSTPPAVDGDRHAPSDAQPPSAPPKQRP